MRARGAIVAAIACLAATAAVAAPAAHASKRCKAPTYPGLGYFTSLSVTGTSCAGGGKVAVAYYKCRLRHGVKGRCTTTVLGYRCTEKRNSIATEIDARVTCRKGSRRVVHTYQQNT
ncbi:MAG: hypothetical protein QOE11_1163 [Solirubrobacteraceae bacterium]|nr:hypothetical protein [Solirubrobacteraceae bacterium]